MGKHQKISVDLFILKFITILLIQINFACPVFYCFTCYWIETTKGSSLFCFHHQVLSKWFEKHLTFFVWGGIGMIQRELTHHPLRRRLVIKGVQMSWETSKCLASLRQGNGALELGKGFALQEKRLSPALWMTGKNDWLDSEHEKRKLSLPFYKVSQ